MGRVLVVDDDEILRMLLQAHLKQTGHRVLLAASAQEAISVVEEHGPPDVAVLDITLPDSDGFELAQKLRAATDSARLPIIFLSGNVDETHIEEGRQLGAVYLTKPYIRTALCNAVDKALVEPDGW